MNCNNLIQLEYLNGILYKTILTTHTVFIHVSTFNNCLIATEPKFPPKIIEMKISGNIATGYVGYYNL